jgi:hypothetical protein
MKMKTPAEVAAIFGCTPEQAKALQLRNAASLMKMSQKALSTGKKVNNYTGAELAARAAAFVLVAS